MTEVTYKTRNEPRKA